MVDFQQLYDLLRKIEKDIIHEKEKIEYPSDKIEDLISQYRYWIDMFKEQLSKGDFYNNDDFYPTMFSCLSFCYQIEIEFGRMDKKCCPVTEELLPFFIMELEKEKSENDQKEYSCEIKVISADNFKSSRPALYIPLPTAEEIFAFFINWWNKRKKKDGE